MVKDLIVVVCGQKGCGKTSLLEALINGKVPNSSVHSPTIEDIYCAQFFQKGTVINERLRIFDTAGIGDNCDRIPRHLLCFADIFVIVYSINSEKSFRCMEDIKRDVDKNKEKKDAQIIILGTKVDLSGKREIDPTVAQIWASYEKVKLWEVTALDRPSLIEPFWYVTSKFCALQSNSIFSNLKKDRRK